METKPELVAYLETKKISLVSVLRHGKEWTMSPCPHCGKESTGNDIHFSVSPENVGFCQVCKRSGNIFQYKKMFGDNSFTPTQESDGRSFRDKKGALLAQWKRKTRKKKLATNDMVLPMDYIPFSMQALQMAHPTAESARNYLFSRGFNLDTINHWRLGLAFRGFCSGKDVLVEGVASCDFYGSAGKGGVCPKCGREVVNRSVWLSVPYFSQGKEHPATLVKYRSLPPSEKAFQREAGGASDIFGTWFLDSKVPSCVITEGELDAIALTQLGIRNVVCLAGGASISLDWLSEFEPYETIYLAGDSDAPGEANIEKWADALGAFRCRVVQWPEGIKDAAQFLEQGGTGGDFEKLQKAAERIVGKVFLRGDDLKEPLDKFLHTYGEARGQTTSWSDVDKVIGGIRYGEWTAVTGDTGSGKSIWSSQLALNLARSGVPAAVASFELRIPDVAMRVVTQVAGRSVYTMRNDALSLNAAIEEVSQIPIYFLDLYGEIALPDLKQILAFGVSRYGIRFLVLDHLHYFLPGLDERNEKTVIDNACRTFTQWSAEWGVHIMLIVHPTKFSAAQKVHAAKRVDGDMLKGSSGIKQEAFNIFSLYRARGYEKGQIAQGVHNEGAAELSVLKCRSPLGREGVVWFKYDLDSLLYESLPATENLAMHKLDASGYKKVAVDAGGEESEVVKTKRETKKDKNSQKKDDSFEATLHESYNHI